ncbi:MAG: PAS domain S-box-containing protein, partial [Gammaproteobacteria bacterium]
MQFRPYNSKVAPNTEPADHAAGRAIVHGAAAPMKHPSPDSSASEGFEPSEGSFDLSASAILASVLDPTLTIDGRGTILSASRSVETVLGYHPDEVTGKNISLLMPEPHHSQHDQYLENYRRTGVTHILGETREFEVIRKDGRHIDCELSVGRADIQGASEPIFVGSFRDISERKHAERKLIRSEERFRAIFDQEFQHVGLLSRDGTILEMNSTALKAIGASADDVRGHPFWQAPWWHHSPLEQDRVRQAILDAADGRFVRFEVELELDDGSTRSIDFSLKPIRDEGGRVQLLLPEGRDITELKRAQRAETAMLRTLAAIGEGAATLAHEIKNPITAINIALRAVAEQLGEDDRVVLEDLASRMIRLEGLMRQTLSYATPLTIEKSTCRAFPILDNARLLLREALAASGT